MALMEYLKNRKLASAKAKPSEAQEPSDIFEKVSEKYKEKTPEMTKEVKKTKIKKPFDDDDSLKIKAIGAAQKVKRMMEEEKEPRLKQRLNEREEIKGEMLDEDKQLEKRLRRRLLENKLIEKEYE